MLNTKVHFRPYNESFLIYEHDYEDRLVFKFKIAIKTKDRIYYLYAVQLPTIHFNMFGLRLVTIKYQQIITYLY